MTRYKKIKIFLIKRIIGITFLVMSFLILSSLISYNVNDPGFGISGSGNIKNWLGIYGAYTASFLLVFIDNSSYLIVFFFFITGFRLTFGLYSKYLSLRFFLLILGIAGFNLSLTSINFKGGILGLFLQDVLNDNFNNYLSSFYFFWLVFAGVLITSITLIYFSLGISFGRFILPFIKLFNFTSVIIKYLKILKILIPKLPTSANTIIKIKRNVRAEPTIDPSPHTVKKDNSRKKKKIIP